MVVRVADRTEDEVTQLRLDRRVDKVDSVSRFLLYTSFPHWIGDEESGVDLLQRFDQCLTIAKRSFDQFDALRGKLLC